MYLINPIDLIRGRLAIYVATASAISFKAIFSCEIDEKIWDNI